MRLGLVGCSQLKLPVPAPAWLLYSASTRFSQAFQVARAECAQVLILSAKHGLVPAARVLGPYNLALKDLSAVQRHAWSQRVCTQLAQSRATLVSYCSAQYEQLLTPLALEHPYRGGLFARATAMGQHGSLRQIDWPMAWLLCFLQEHPGIAWGAVRQEIRHRGYVPVTIDCQCQRIQRCPLYQIQGGRIYPRYTEEAADALAPQ